MITREDKLMQTQVFTGLMLPPEALLSDENLRYSLKQSRIDSLADDILAQGGVMQNLEVETLASPVNGCTHKITSGHYRKAAVEKLNKEGAGLLLPCTVVQTTDATNRLKRQLSENIARESLSPMDTAYAIQKLTDAGVAKTEIRHIFSRPGGKKGNKMQDASNSFVNMMLSFREFPKGIQKKVHEGIIGVSGAYTLTKKPPERWEEIVAQLEADRQEEIDQEEKEDEKLQEREQKVAEVEAKQQTAVTELETAKSDLQAKSAEADKATEVEVLAHRATTSKELTAEARKVAQKEFEEAQVKATAAYKAAEAAKAVVAKLEKKAITATKQAEDKRQKLEAATKPKPAVKTAPKPASSKAIEKASVKVGIAASETKLSANDMREYVEEWALPGTYPKVQEIAKVIVEAFKGLLTPAQAYGKMGKITGEKVGKKAAVAAE